MPDLGRTLDELAARYRLDPDIGREIYVEGLQDKIVLEHLARRWGVSAPIYTANTINVPHEILRARGLEFPSARSTLIAARIELQERGVDLASRIFLIDRDLEDCVPTPWVDGCVLTDHGCLVASILNEDVLERLINVVGRGVISKTVFWNSVCEILMDLYVVRVVARENLVPLSILPQTGFIYGSKVGGFGLRLREYLLACSRSCGVSLDIDSFLRLFETRKSQVRQIISDPRSIINDHDLWVVIRTILRSCGDGVNRSAEDIRDLVLMGIDERSFEGGALDERVRRVIALPSLTTDS